MDKFMSIEEWLKRTDGGMFSQRSVELKAVDEALKQYNIMRDASHLQALKIAMTKWLTKEGDGWRNSVRNKNKENCSGKMMGPVEILYAQVTGKQDAAIVTAVAAVRQDTLNRLNHLFKGKHFQARSGWIGKVEALISSDKTLKSTKLDKAINTYTVASVPSTAYDLAEAIMGKLVPDKAMAARVLAELGHVLPDFAGHLAASLVPFAGVVVSGGTTVLSAVSFVKKQSDLYSAREHAEANLAIGDPGAAVQALIHLLERARNNAGAKLAVGMTEFSGKLGATLLDGGTVSNAAIGLAGAVAKLVLLIMAMYIDLSEMDEGNRYMNDDRLMLNGKINPDIFTKCPIVGAYMISCAPASDFVNSLFESSFFLRPDAGIVLQREFMTHIEPLRIKARELILAHRLHIPDLEIYATNFKHA